MSPIAGIKAKQQRKRQDERKVTLWHTYTRSCSQHEYAPRYWLTDGSGSDVDDTDSTAAGMAHAGPWVDSTGPSAPDGALEGVAEALMGGSSAGFVMLPRRAGSPVEGDMIAG